MATYEVKIVWRVEDCDSEEEAFTRAADGDAEILEEHADKIEE